MGTEGGRNRKLKANNERAALAEVKHFLCYFCGESFGGLLDYQRHVTYYHQILALSYQLWSSKVKPVEKSRKNRGTDSRSSAERQESTSSEREPESLKGGKTPRSTDQQSSSSSITSTSLKRPLEGDNEPKPAKKRKISSAEKSEAGSPLNYEEGTELSQGSSPARSEKKSKSKVEKEKKKKETKKAEQKIVNEGSALTKTTPTNAKDGDLRQCEICSFTCTSFFNCIEHYIVQHGAKVGHVNMFLFNQQKLVARKVSPPGDNCPRCEERFKTNEDYFLHLLCHHVEDIVGQLRENNPRFAEVNNADTEVTLRFNNHQDLVYCYNVVV